MSSERLWRRSLSWRLVFFILVPSLLLLVVAGSLTAYRSKQSVDDLFDRQLVHSADILLAFLQHEGTEAAQEGDDEGEDESIDAEMGTIVTELKQQYQLDVQYRIYLKNERAFTTEEVKHFGPCPLGFSNFFTQSGPEAEEWRCYKGGLQDSNKQFSVEVEFFEKIETRQQSTRKLLVTTFTPFLLLPFAIALIVLWAVRRGLQPLMRVSSEISARSVNNLQQLTSTALPQELKPVVHAVNNLLKGIKHGMEREKQFSDDAAHELRTPLTSMSMLEQLMRRDNSDPTLIPHLDSLHQSIAKGRRLVDQLLLFARLQSSRNLQREPLMLNELIEEQLGELSPQMTSKNLSITIDLGEAHYFSANRDAMALLLGNVINNAIKFSEAKGEIYIFRDANLLRIEDDGPGVVDEDREQIFGRFYRSSKTSQKSGSGLGLSLAKWVADQHHFGLSCTSPIRGKGAGFLLTLPK